MSALGVKPKSHFEGVRTANSDITCPTAADQRLTDTVEKDLARRPWSWAFSPLGT
jgi:hypothetical protein